MEILSAHRLCSAHAHLESKLVLDHLPVSGQSNQLVGATAALDELLRCGLAELHGHTG